MSREKNLNIKYHNKAKEYKEYFVLTAMIIVSAEYLIIRSQADPGNVKWRVFALSLTAMGSQFTVILGPLSNFYDYFYLTYTG